jgi:hypothetical protein
MHNPFLLHPQQLRQIWKDIRKSLDPAAETVVQLKTVSDFWNRAPTSSPYLDCLDTSSWPDAWILIESKLFDHNTLALGMFYTLLLSDTKQFTADRLKLVWLRNNAESWERLVCIVDDRWLLNYDRENVVDTYLLPDMLCMHTYKYDLHKRRIIEISQSMLDLHPA